jgi:hypothetical protein
MAEAEAPDGRPAKARRFLRVFLMVAGGLAAPMLALAAFFLSSGGGSDTPARPAAVQAGVTGATAPRTTAASAPAAPATTSTTTAPAPPSGPLRDPFVPLVTQAPPAGTPAR